MFLSTNPQKKIQKNQMSLLPQTTKHLMMIRFLNLKRMIKKMVGRVKVKMVNSLQMVKPKKPKGKRRKHLLVKKKNQSQPRVRKSLNQLQRMEKKKEKRKRLIRLVQDLGHLKVNMTNQREVVKMLKRRVLQKSLLKAKPRRKKKVNLQDLRKKKKRVLKRNPKKNLENLRRNQIQAKKKKILLVQRKMRQKQVMYQKSLRLVRLKRERKARKIQKYQTLRVDLGQDHHDQPKGQNILLEKLVERERKRKKMEIIKENLIALIQRKFLMNLKVRVKRKREAKRKKVRMMRFLKDTLALMVVNLLNTPMMVRKKRKMVIM